MRQLILFLATAAMVYLASSSKTRSTIDAVSGQDISKSTFVLIMAVTAGLIVVAIDSYVPREEDDIIEDFMGPVKRYTTNPVNQYVSVDNSDKTKDFSIPITAQQDQPGQFDPAMTKYFIGRNQGLIHKYSAAREAPENCIKAKQGLLETPAEVVFGGKPLSFYQKLSVNAGMPLYKGVQWK